MGVHDSPCISHYWRQDSQEGPLHLPRLYMNQLRFEQIKGFLHIARPDSAENQQEGSKRWWYKLEPLASSFESAAKQYYQPGSNVSIDGTMIRCFGRSKHTIKMPNKPIKQGYKIFALAEYGYIWTFTWSSRLWGIVDLFRWPGISPTGSMVLEMIRRLPGLGQAASQASSHPSGQTNGHASGHATICKTAPYIVYMDNYFCTVGLFKALRDIQCGACGTTRKQGGIPPYLAELKDHIKAIPWGKLYASEAQGVLCLAWQDNNIVLLLSTIHTPYLYTQSQRKRPAATSTNAAIGRAPFW